MVSLRFREFLTGYVAEEFDSLVAQLRAFFSVSFHEDGTLIGVDPGLATVRIGMVFPYAGPSAPSGYLLCDGSQVSRVTYKALFEVISTTFGVGDGSTTFQVPDLRQRFPLGKAASGTGAALGATGGAIDHTHGGGAHTHGIASDGDHVHAVSPHDHAITAEPDSLTSGMSPFNFPVQVQTSFSSGIYASSDPHGHTITGHDHDALTGPATTTMATTGAHTHGGTTGAASGATDPANPPFCVFNFVILAGA